MKMNMCTDERLSFCQLLFESNNVPISGISEEGEILFSFMGTDSDSSLAHCSKGLLRGLSQALGTKEIDTPTIQITEEKLVIGAVPCNGAAGFLLIGPIPHILFDEEKIPQVIKRYHIKNADEFTHSVKYFLPHVGIKSFAALCRLVYYNEWKHAPLLSHTIFDTDMEQDHDYAYHSVQASTIIKSGDDRVQAIPPGKATPLIQYIMKGDSAAALKYLREITTDIDEYSPYSSAWIAKFMPQSPSDYSDINMSRIMFINAVSHITEVLLGEGFADEQGWLLWYYYVDKALHTDTVREINRLSFEMVVDFSERSIPSLQDTSYQVYRCMSYIREHLTESITPAMVVKAVNANFRYLSDQFKKETGISISKYIQRERVNAAKTLLIYTSRDLIDISNSLDFSSQSYFTSVFKRFSGYTPDAYREKFGRRDRDHQ